MYNNSNNSVLPEEATKFHFALKLWIVINDEKVYYLRWNAEETAVVIDLSSIRTTYMRNLFGMETVDHFLWLLQFNGFEPCSLEDNELSDSAHVAYRHSVFAMSNEQLFHEWLIEASKKKTSCWLLPGSLAYEFRPREMADYFQKAKAKITAEMHLLDSHIKREFRKYIAQDEIHMNVPLQFLERIASQPTTWEETSCTTGYYGIASESEVLDFYGPMLPVTKDPDTSDAGFATREEEDDIFIIENSIVDTNIKIEECVETDSTNLNMDEDTPSMITNSVHNCTTIKIEECVETDSTSLNMDEDTPSMIINSVHNCTTIKIEECDETDSTSLNMDEDTAGMITNSVRNCIEPLEFD